MFTKVPKKFHPPGFELLYEDQDIIVGNKAAGLLTVAAKWNREHTVETLLNLYVGKGNPKSSKRVYVVHRLDQATTGLLVFAKTEAALKFLKGDWPQTKKTYLAIVHRTPSAREGVIESYLSEDEDYHVHSSQHAQPVEGATGDSKLARTLYRVLKSTPKFALLEVDLQTGRKNQIRVHMADLKHPIVGDKKYGPGETPNRNLMLHSWKLELTHPFNKKRLSFEAAPPRYLTALVPLDASSGDSGSAKPE